MFQPLAADPLTSLAALIGAVSTFLRAIAGLIVAADVGQRRRFGPASHERPAPVASPPLSTKDKHPVTPDGRYFVVRGRLWRRPNPDLPEASRQALVKQLMAARRAVQTAHRAGDDAAAAAAHAAVDEAKRQLGERGPGWWSDGAPDLNRRMATNTPYADWFAALKSTTPPCP